MRTYVIAATILALGLLSYGYITTPKYTMVRLDDSTVVRLNLWTGAVELCAQWDDNSFGCVAEGISHPAK